MVVIAAYRGCHRHGAHVGGGDLALQQVNHYARPAIAAHQQVVGRFRIDLARDRAVGEQIQQPVRPRLGAIEHGVVIHLVAVAAIDLNVLAKRLGNDVEFIAIVLECGVRPVRPAGNVVEDGRPDAARMIVVKEAASSARPQAIVMTHKHVGA